MKIMSECKRVLKDTGCMFVNIGKHFIGMDLSSDYFEMSKKRIELEEQQTRLEL